VDPSELTFYHPSRYSWDIHGFLRTGKITLEQLLTAFLYDYDPILRHSSERPRAAASVPRAGMMFCKGR